MGVLVRMVVGEMGIRIGRIAVIMRVAMRMVERMVVRMVL
jgi:hypothetical protein